MKTSLTIIFIATVVMFAVTTVMINEIRLMRSQSALPLSAERAD